MHERLYDERPPSPPRSARRLGDTDGSSTPVLSLGLPDQFIDHGEQQQLMSLIGLDATGIEASIRAHTCFAA